MRDRWGVLRGGKKEISVLPNLSDEREVIEQGLMDSVDTSAQQASRLRLVEGRGEGGICFSGA